MGTREHQNRLEPPSPIEMLQKLSDEAVRKTSGTWKGGHSPINSTIVEQVPRHRRAHSEAATAFYSRSYNNNNSFQKLKSQMQKALHWGSRSFREDSNFLAFDPEILANQKRQWYQLQSNKLDPEKYKEPTSLFEHFIIAGIRPDTNLDVVEDAFVKRKKWEKDTGRPEVNTRQYKRPALPTLEPQVLSKYPPGKKLSLRFKDLAAFCFPGGVQARVLERTPSFSELNELVYGQEHLSRDDLSFIFSLKAADNATLYGVCLHVQEVVQRPPPVPGMSPRLYQFHPRCNKFLVSAPRCYCILTRVPFFELHYEMLNSIIAQERLNRITRFVNEMSLSDYSPSPSPCKSKNHTDGFLNSPGGESNTDWMASAIPLDSATAVTAAAAGIISDEDVSPSRWDMNSPSSVTTSDASDYSQTRDMDKDSNKSFFHDCCSETPEHTYKVHFDCPAPEIGSYVSRSDQLSESFQSFESMFRRENSPARSILSEDDDANLYEQNKDPKEDVVLEWARENKYDLLQIVCGYHSIPLPERGNEIIFQPLEHLQAIEYRRPPVSSLGISDNQIDLNLKKIVQAPQTELKLATAEEAASLSLWTTATICRVLSLESVLSLVTGVLLEKQVVVLCPNLGVLSALVLSIMPIIRPFEWQSLFLPVLPEKMLDFLEAPVPFVVGIQHKPDDLKMKTSSLVQVNVSKDQVKTCSLPTLPNSRKLVSELKPYHSVLSSQDSLAQRHPVYKCSEVQAEAAGQFLAIMGRYLESLCSDLRLHTITSVQSTNDRVSILLKDSFIDSFPVRDQPFIKLFIETQLFTVLSDCRLSSYENDYL